MRLAVSGFEPFGGRASNRSWLLASSLCQNPPPGLELERSQLPVSFAALPGAVATLVAGAVAAGARGLIMLGESQRSPGLELERVALNLIDAEQDDNAGQRPRDLPVLADGPAARFSTAPIRDLHAAARASGAPAELSLSAGAFACNASYYLALAAAPAELPVVFIHVPQGPGGPPDRVLVLALAAIAMTLASHPGS